MRKVFLALILTFLFEAVAQQEALDTGRRVFIENQFYLSPRLHNSQLSSYRNVGGYFYAQQDRPYWFYDIDLKLQLSLDTSEQHYLSIAQSNIGWQMKDFESTTPYLDFMKVSIGRYIGNWSRIDREWQLSLWNPNHLYDPLRARELGIIGSSISFGGQYWYIESFVGGFFLPEARPPWDSKGQTRSTSRWVTVPSSTISLFEQDIYSFYKIEKPYLQNVLLQTSYIGKVLVGDEDEKWISFSYAYKPLNQIFFKNKAILSIPEDSIHNTIHYHSLKHQLSTIESGFHLGSWRGHIGILNENIDDVELTKYWLFPILPDYFFASVTLSKELRPLSWNHSSIAFSFLNSLERNPNYSENLIGADVHSIITLDRFKIRKGFFASLSSSFLLENQKFVDFFIRYWYSATQKGGWLESQFTVRISQNISLDVEFDILGKKDLYQRDFLGKYGHNDRILVRLSSVF